MKIVLNTIVLALWIILLITVFMGYMPTQWGVIALLLIIISRSISDVTDSVSERKLV